MILEWGIGLEVVGAPHNFLVVLLSLPSGAGLCGWARRCRLIA